MPMWRWLIALCGRGLMGAAGAAPAPGFQDSEVLTDSERPAAKNGSDIRKYPRSCWKETYDASKGNYKK